MTKRISLTQYLIEQQRGEAQMREPPLHGVEEEVMAVIEKAILLFKDEGIAGERFADTVKRLGFEYVNEKLIG